jgi:PQQ enzyme repeat
MVKDFASRSLTAFLLLTLGACSSSSRAPLTGKNQPVTIESQPSDQTAVIGQTATFSVVASGSAPLSYQWQKAGVTISGATSASYITPAVTAGDNGSQFQVVVSNASGSATSGAATLHVLVNGTDVVTYHNDNSRSGLNPNETTLTTANVSSATFGKIGFYSTDGQVNAQPLYLSQVNIPSQGSKNVVYAATEHDSVYAFDAGTGTVLWKASVLGSNESTSDNLGCGQVSPEIGITATPVIDRTRGPNGAIYVVAMSKDSSGQYHQRIHALDITTGAELFGGPKNITASYPGTGDNSSGGNVIFDPKQYVERPGLLLLNGTVYTTWGSHCDSRPYTAWVMGFDANTLAQTTVLNLVPNGNEGGMWMGGTAPAADNSGNIFVLVGNGTFDTTLNASGFPNQGDCGNCFAKLSTSGSLKLADYFTMFNTVQESNADEDLGSGGAILLPDLTDSSNQVHHLALGAGKDAHIYVVDRDSMAKFNPNSNNNYQDITGALSGRVFSMPAYFNNTVYFGAVSDSIKSFPISNARLATTAAMNTSNTFAFPGATPSISANGSGDAILWAVENSSPAVLHAYDAANLSHELYNSNQVASRDNFGAGNKFITPTVVNGKVYVGTGTGVAVFGLLP